ncbi:MAG: ubiquinol-cytochrome C chaperone [Afipia sp.]|nr:ubiquinol-cytochrome C chaperone [Afipia sp.]
MLWPFNRFGKSAAPPRQTIEAIYGMIVAQAREPAFYLRYNVPDTVNGRLDLLILHLWLVLRRLRRAAAGADLSQALFDRFCTDMDANLREMGVGDLTVPKRMQAFGEAFYGRSTAYDLAIESGRGDFAQAISRNVLDGKFADSALRLADYGIAVSERLADESDAAIADAAWSFPKPASE